MPPSRTAAVLAYIFDAVAAWTYPLGVPVAAVAPLPGTPGALSSGPLAAPVAAGTLPPITVASPSSQFSQTGASAGEPPFDPAVLVTVASEMGHVTVMVGFPSQTVQTVTTVVKSGGRMGLV
jgi:hypothetical protein